MAGSELTGELVCAERILRAGTAVGFKTAGLYFLLFS